jgi:predicted transcriptional regulator
MSDDISGQLGRRERQLIEALYRRGKASVADVRKALPDPPSYSAVRAMLNLLVEKGHVKHEREGMRYLYSPVMAAPKARQSALRHLVATFFQGSPGSAATALLEMAEGKLSKDERARIAALISQAEREER